MCCVVRLVLLPAPCADAGVRLDPWIRCGVVKAAQKCELCGDQLLHNDFYLFPCTHGFHSNCLIGEVRMPPT